LIVVDPGHFHAALVEKEMYPNLSPEVHVYAPVGPDLVGYLARIAASTSASNRRAGSSKSMPARISSGARHVENDRVAHRARRPFRAINQTLPRPCRTSQPAPGAEEPNILAKYYVCTEGVAMSQG